MYTNLRKLPETLISQHSTNHESLYAVFLHQKWMSFDVDVINKVSRENSTKSMECHNTAILKDMYASLSYKSIQREIKETKNM